MITECALLTKLLVYSPGEEEQTEDHVPLHGPNLGHKPSRMATLRQVSLSICESICHQQVFAFLVT